MVLLFAKKVLGAGLAARWIDTMTVGFELAHHARGPMPKPAGAEKGHLRLALLPLVADGGTACRSFATC